MYKREMCKNWSESGFCRYGTKCQYAHGVEEMSEAHQAFLNEQKQGLNDKYKSQNCRQFYREKFCPYGKRCHFRHEYRSFKKIHRHYYQCHLAAISITHFDVLADSENARSGKCEENSKLELSFESSSKLGNHVGLKQQSSTDLSTDECSDHQEDSLLTGNTLLEGRRLPIFQSLTSIEEADDYKGKEEEQSEGNTSLLKLMKLEE